MCYNARYLLEKALKRARYFKQHSDIEYYEKAIEKYDEQYQVSGYTHPRVIIYKNDEPYQPKLATWGLIPHWVKDSKAAKDIWNKTLNARGESIFEKPAFRDSAKHKRCLIPIAGYFEHQHYKGKKYPYYISRTDEEPLNLAGLWSEWVNRESGEILQTCSIITTSAREHPLLSKIHNNPKLPEPRMPVLLDEEHVEEWLKPYKTENDKMALQNLLLPDTKIELNAHTVKPLSGKNSVGNTPESSEEFVYEELEVE